MFLAGWPGIRERNFNALRRWPQYNTYFEPLTIFSAMAAVTEHIGFVATASTTFMEPYNLSRFFASLDHISNGRAGWNVVTTAAREAAANFGKEDLMSHAERYERAHEYVDVVKGLWDSWDDDAFPRNRETGVYFDPDKMHRLNHKGKYLSVAGPLNMERPPQGHPLIVQAGTSEDGRNLAATIADMVFLMEMSLDSAKRIYKDVKERAVKFGRQPEDLLVTPGMATIVCKTADEAKRQHEFLLSKIHPEVGLEIIRTQMNYVDIGKLDVDKPFPQELIPTDDSTHSRRTRELLAQNPRTVREMYERMSVARTAPLLIGDPIQVADQLQQWHEERGADGFIIQPAYLPGGLDDFVDLVVPELQRRGIYRTDYEGKTLRENLGLKRPMSIYT